jgi:hypothetical protein
MERDCIEQKATKETKKGTLSESRFAVADSRLDYKWKAKQAG